MLVDLYLRHAAELRSFLTARLRCEQTAADLTQEVFVRLLGQEAAAIANPLALAYRIARNLLVDHHRGRRPDSGDGDEPCFDEMTGSAPDPQDVAAARQRLDRLESAIARLPPQCRRAFVLNRLEGLSQAQVAERMGISRQVVERHIAKALVLLREQVDGRA